MEVVWKVLAVGVADLPTLRKACLWARRLTVSVWGVHMMTCASPCARAYHGRGVMVFVGEMWFNDNAPGLAKGSGTAMVQRLRREEA